MTDTTTTPTFLPDKKSEKRFYNSLFWRSQWLMFCTSYTKQQAVTFSWVMLPYLEKIYGKDTDEFYAAMLRHQDFFNTNVAVAPFVFGVVTSMEKENKENGVEAKSINALKSSLMGPLAGIGDSLLANGVRLIATGIAIGFFQQGSWLGPILFMLLLNIPNWGIKWLSGKYGYKLGNTFITDAMKSGTLNLITKAASIVGLMMVGAMSAQYVTFKTVLKIKSASQVVDIQKIFDMILPGLLPLLLVLGCFFYLRKKNKPVRVLLAVVVLAFVLTFLGITGAAK
ncbi:PTS system mannose fructose sorbose family IIDsubunit [Agrilactobacillus composti DSM 18527 = JCM 14202]|uniref:PTS system mannose fructose sorbose family IIDsubunit n=1 Tax=Agrilactobacillus composti DSM 18527 = JCM 14202 TaxID=1423734 RepID=A0A0R1Y682_9LACO|nr:PTS system mannose/fructose/sorbose family transporter subunit IID [Agrilactobacillus composti]KRM34844.1 PTS system mannose fructose sorbose family IIDsubunit [Agrilactobacillus composti DSM 18527 = JCM 14202]